MRRCLASSWREILVSNRCLKIYADVSLSDLREKQFQLHWCKDSKASAKPGPLAEYTRQHRQFIIGRFSHNLRRHTTACLSHIESSSVLSSCWRKFEMINAVMIELSTPFTFTEIFRRVKYMVPQVQDKLSGLVQHLHRSGSLRTWYLCPLRSEISIEATVPM
jgi:hypothetical protein